VVYGPFKAAINIHLGVTMMVMPKVNSEACK
jgi:hypothetical protein